ncbi:MAG TPA: DUF5996 family protein [Candidatus Binatia bacterium]|nr:DUF5996 family protein [Candidatus Binatia bacterium]
MMETWPPLPLAEWRETYATLHMWTQIVGKIRMALTPAVNHWWHVVLYVTPRGLTTSPIPYGDRHFEIDFDLLAHELVVQNSEGRAATLALRRCTVADFHAQLMETLAGLGIQVRIWPVPVEVPDPIRFTVDRVHAAYDRDAVERLHRVLVQSDAVFKEFRGSFLGKCSPVHFFWGSFDLAVTRFSGRRAPVREGADPVTREAYSHEVISHGFWPGGVSVGGVRVERPVYYAYAAPEPSGLPDRAIRPATAGYDRALSEFIVGYDEIRSAPSPRAALLEFMQSTYAAAATLAGWDRAALER